MAKKKKIKKVSKNQQELVDLLINYDAKSRRKIVLGSLTGKW